MIYLISVFAILFLVLIIYTIYGNVAYYSAVNSQVRAQYPGITRAEIVQRRRNINRYRQQNLKSSRFNLRQSVVTTVVMIVAFVAVVMFILGDDKIALIFASLVFLVLGLMKIFLPSVNDRVEFWNDYLKDNPENPLNVLEPNLVIEQKSNAVQDIISGILVLIGIILLWMAIIY